MCLRGRGLVSALALHVVPKLRSRRKLCSGHQASPGAGKAPSGGSGGSRLPRLGRPALAGTGAVAHPNRMPAIVTCRERPHCRLQGRGCGPASAGREAPGPSAEPGQTWPRPRAPAGDAGKGRGDMAQPPASWSRAAPCLRTSHLGRGPAAAPLLAEAPQRRRLLLPGPREAPVEKWLLSQSLTVAAGLTLLGSP